MDTLKVKQLKEFFGNLNSAFIGVRGYASKTGLDTTIPDNKHICNYRVLVGSNYAQLVQNDIRYCYDKLNNDMTLTDAEEQALTELVERLEKNSGEEPSVGSKAQQDAYIKICTGVEYNPNTELIYIRGRSMGRKVITQGVFKVVKSRNEVTHAKKQFRKEFETAQWRNFIVDSIDRIAVLGHVIDPNNVTEDEYTNITTPEFSETTE